ncbi:hypothetical protein HYU19_04920 [Candidatus Woesearchaeota archaeon]|nr:hypothetical protein [Candidatus Woesearchaeota archaeon]
MPSPTNDTTAEIQTAKRALQQAIAILSTEARYADALYLSTTTRRISKNKKGAATAA